MLFFDLDLEGAVKCQSRARINDRTVVTTLDECVEVVGRQVAEPAASRLHPRTGKSLKPTQVCHVAHLAAVLVVVELQVLKVIFQRVTHYYLVVQDLFQLDRRLARSRYLQWAQS